MEYDPFSGAVGYLRNVFVRGNFIEQIGRRAIDLATCDNCVFENNVIMRNLGGSSASFYIPDFPRGDGALTRNVTLRNNSVFVGPEATGLVIGLQLEGDEGAGHVVVSNLFALMTDSAQACCVEQSFRGNPQGPYAIMDYNVCASLQTNGRFNWARGFRTLSSWADVTGFDTHSLQGDPGVVSLMANMVDLRPAEPDSAIVGRGHPNLSAPVDFEGRARTETPDIGAYEFHGDE